MDDETRQRFDQLEARLDTRFDRIENQLGSIVARLDRFNKVPDQMEAVLTRLDELETGQDGLAAKIDRQATMASTAIQAAEQSLTSLTAVSRRVARLEGGS